MNSLPSLVLREIFSYFSLKEKCHLKAVCRQWKNELDSYRTTSLCLCYLVSYPQNIQWAFTNDLISNLTGFEELLHRINEFERLEQLEIYGVHLAETRIESDKLGILSLKYSTFRSLQLDTAALEALICHEEIAKVRFKHPAQLKRLLVSKYHQHIEQLVNLEQLACIVFEAVDSKFLERFPKLRQIQLNNRKSDHSVDDSVIRELRRQRFVLGLAELEIVAFRFDHPFYRINDPDYAITSTNVAAIRDDYSRIPLNLQFLFEVDYVAVCRTFKPLPSDFFAKFSDIEVVRIEGQVDQGDLMRFLKQCVHLYSVWIQSTGLGQTFFDQLHEIQALEELTVEEPEWRISDYGFLDRLKHLKTILIYSPLFPIRLFRLFFERIEYASELYFRNTSYASVQFEVSLFIYRDLENQSFETTFDTEQFRRFKSLTEVLDDFVRNDSPLKNYLLDS